MPVRARGKTIGTIKLGTRTPRKFKPEDIRLFTAIGNQLGIAVQKSKLYETTPQNLEHMRALHEIDKAITSTMDLRATFDC